ncbi:MAG: DUF3429 family protein [Halioglobus sp.]|nr:DUF3429 family protein [Halioglobus sp.]
MKTLTVPRTASALGWAGLLPFAAAPLLLGARGDLAPLIGPAIAAYALAILCFLVGAWWGIALLRRHPAILLLSNAMVVAACLGVVLLERGHALLLLAVSLLITVAVERRHPMFAPQPGYYAALRLRLSVVAALSLLLTALLL